MKLFFKEKINEVWKKTGEIRISVFWQGIIMFVSLMSIGLISIFGIGILRDNIKSPYLELAIDITIAIFAICAFINLVKWDTWAINPLIYPRNIKAIYGAIENQKNRGTPDAVCDIMVMSAAIFHDNIKKDGRIFSPSLAQRIRAIIIKIENKRITFYQN